MSPFSLRKYSFLIWNASFRALLSLSIIAFLTFWPTGTAQESVSTDPVELEALFEVMTGINSDTDWRTQLPDPCLDSQQGIYCLPDNAGEYYVTNFEFGFISDYDNLIACSGNANLHPSIAQLHFLETLFIYNCFVNGSATVPSEIGRLSNSLQMLTFHGNSALGGALASELGNLTSLQRMVLTENSCEGPVPFLLAFLKKLGTNLILSNNLGLCISPANAREAVATLGVNICADCSSLGTSGGEAHSPNSAPGFGSCS